MSFATFHAAISAAFILFRLARRLLPLERRRRHSEIFAAQPPPRLCRQPFLSFAMISLLLLHLFLCSAYFFL